MTHGAFRARRAVPRPAAALWIAAAALAFWVHQQFGDPASLLVACCAAAPVVVALCWRPRLGNVRVHVELPRRAAAGETVRQHVEVTNAGHRASPPATVTLSMRGWEDAVVDVPGLPAGGVAALSLPRRALRRGSDDVQIVSIMSPLFGIAERGFSYVVHGEEVVVHPVPVRGLRLVTHGGGEGEQPAGVPARSGIHLHGVREWRPGDDVRRVHWRATARHGRLVIVEPERSVDRPLAVVVAGRAGDVTWEALLALWAATVVQALRDGRRVLLVAQEARTGARLWLEPGTTEAALDWFALLEPPMVPGADLLREARRWGLPGGSFAVASTDDELRAAVLRESRPPEQRATGPYGPVAATS